MYTKKVQFLFLLIFLSGILLLVCLFTSEFLQSYPTTSDTNCIFFPCFIKSFYYVYFIKSINVFFGIFSSIFLLVLIKFKLKSDTTVVKRISKTLLKNMILTTTTDIIPYSITLIYLNVSL